MLTLKKFLSIFNDNDNDNDNEEEYGILTKVYSSISDLPPSVKKLEEKKQRQFMHVWNSAYNKSKDETSAFKQAWGVVNKIDKSEPTPSDLHVDSFLLSEEDKKKMKEMKTEDTPVEKFVEIKKNTLKEGLVYGIVYEPMIKDAHGDWSTKEEIQKMAHDFLPSALRNGPWTDKDHSKDGLSDMDVEIVESYIAPVDFELESEHIYKGSWVLVSKVNSEELKSAIEKGETTGYSIFGKGRKIDIDLPKV
jgi:cation transport regulator ChaB